MRQWGTYYGGDGDDLAFGCATDASGNVYLAGRSNSTSGIASSGSYKDTLTGGQDAFLAKFNSAGVRQWATYYGGPANDLTASCIVDGNNDVYIEGRTKSTTGIAFNGFQNSYAGKGTDYDAFIVKFNSAGNPLWGTYYGGTGDDDIRTCAVDGNYNLYAAGTTSSLTGLATPGAFQTTFGGAFLAKIAQNTSQGVPSHSGTYNQIGTIVLYPNPANNDLTLNVTWDASVIGKVVSLSLYNTLGQVVYTNKVQPTNSAAIIKIPLSSNLASGMYAFIIAAEGSQEVKRVIIQR
ncbi:MAG: T9SS type A sorting domain-containing protein, partial [Chitinophagaceae bacterium]